MYSKRIEEDFFLGGDIFVKICYNSASCNDSNAMNKLRFLSGVLSLFISAAAFGEQPDSPMAYLAAMQQAHKQLNYEQLYLLDDGDEVSSWRYRHARQGEERYAQLLKLDELREELIFQNGLLGYFGDFNPFSLRTEKMLDHRPAVIDADFDSLDGYSVIDMGRSRIANRVARTLRVVPNDEFRYQYMLWIDEEHHLLLKSELLDREQNVLEEFRVLQSVVDEQLDEIIEPIKRVTLPTVVPMANLAEKTLSWKPKWLPKGFKLQATDVQIMTNLQGQTEQVESQFFSDGLFSFTIYVAENQGFMFDEQFWRQGKNSIYSQMVGEKNVIVIGELPLASARHIVQEIELNRLLAEGNNK